MTLLEQNCVRAYEQTLLQEIVLLRDNPLYKKGNLNEATFDPLMGDNCFFGQGFGLTEIGPKIDHRRKVGTLLYTGPGNGSYSNEHRLTPLEVWSARLWAKERKEPVLEVLRYLKTPNYEDTLVVVWENE